MSDRYCAACAMDTVEEFCPACGSPTMRYMTPAERAEYDRITRDLVRPLSKPLKRAAAGGDRA